MIHFFRKIRRDLVDNSKTYKYFKYAIGEVVLVVLGILIALYINNQNELRKEQDRFNLVLADVEKELVKNIELSRSDINYLAILDSLYQKVFVDSVKFDNIAYYYLILDGPHKFPIKDDSFKKLNQLNRLTLKQESIRDKLIDLNGEPRLYMDVVSQKLVNLRDSQEEKLMKYDWSNIYLGFDMNGYDEDERITDFFQNDPEYLKMAFQNYKYSYDYRKLLEAYDRESIKVYKDIYKYFDSLVMQHSDSLLFQYNPNEYKKYLGKYDSKWCSDKTYIHDDSIDVSIEKGKLIWTGYKSDGPDTRLEIIPINKYRFRELHYDGGLYHFEFDDQGEVEGVRYSNGLWTLKIKKVR